MAAAHLVISRSGASTVSEIAVIGRPALLVPYPYALDHDQAANAAALAAAGGAEVHAQPTLSPARLAELLRRPDRRPGAACRDGCRGEVRRPPDAARLLADLTEAIASGQTVRDSRR